jgi:hypothetical protein
VAQRYDAVIIGGGHNGLVSAAYLARAGMRTLVLERRHVLGGAPSPRRSSRASVLRSRATWSACSGPRSSATSPARARPGHPAARRDVHPPPRGRGPPRRRWRLPVAGERPRADRPGAASLVEERRGGVRGVRPAHGGDGPLHQADPRDRPGGPYGSRPAPAPAARRPGPRLRAAHGAPAGRLRPAHDDERRRLPRPVVRDRPAQGDDVRVGDHRHVPGHPQSPGTAYVLLHHYMGEIDGAFRAWGIPKGGTGGVSRTSIASAARRRSARRSAPRPPSRASSSGRPRHGRRARERRGDRRGSSSPRPTPRSPSSTCSSRARSILVRGRRSAGSSSAARPARSTSRWIACRTSRACPGEGEHLRGAISFSPSMDDMERAYDDAKYGRSAASPYIDMIIPTLVDPSMAPPGKHVISCFVQYAPYRWTRHWAPGTTTARPSATPSSTGSRSSRRTSATSSSPPGPDPARHRADDGPDRGQHLPGRAEPRAALLQPPGPGLRALPDARPNLWLSGSSTHPGGGLMGANGRLAALEVLKARGRKVA